MILIHVVHGLSKCHGFFQLDRVKQEGERNTKEEFAEPDLLFDQTDTNVVYKRVRRDVK